MRMTPMERRLLQAAEAMDAEIRAQREMIWMEVLNLREQVEAQSRTILLLQQSLDAFLAPSVSPR